MEKELYEIDPEDMTQVIVPGGAVKRIIVCAANKYGDLIICGARHHDEIMSKVVDAIGIKHFTKEQGFIDQYQNYVTREDAAIIVKENKQHLREEIRTAWCFSENLY